MGKFVFYRESSLFSKVASIDVLGPNEMFLQLEQLLLYYLVDPHNLLPNVFHTRKNEKNFCKIFFQRKDGFFFKNFVFNLLLVTEMIVQLPQ